MPTTSESADVLPTGTRLLGEFIIERTVERGPLWTRYTGWRTGPEAMPVQIRAVRWEAVSRAGVVEVFARYVRLLEQLDHPNVVRAITSGVDRGAFMLVVPDPQGIPLREHLLSSPTKRLDPVEVARIVVELASVLDYLHALRPPVVHGALDPKAILLAEPDDRLRLHDVGYAHTLRGMDPELGLDDPTAHAPLPYRAPEHFLSPRELGPRADQFVLASLAYECLVGEPAFADGPDCEASICRGPRPYVASRVADLPSEIDGVLHRAWSPAPEERFRDAVTFGVLLARVLTANDEALIATAMQRGSSHPPRRDSAATIQAIVALPPRVPAPIVTHAPMAPPHSARPNTRRISVQDVYQKPPARPVAPPPPPSPARPPLVRRDAPAGGTMMQRPASPRTTARTLATVPAREPPANAKDPDPDDGET